MPEQAAAARGARVSRSRLRFRRHLALVGVLLLLLELHHRASSSRGTLVAAAVAVAVETTTSNSTTTEETEEYESDADGGRASWSLGYMAQLLPVLDFNYSLFGSFVVHQSAASSSPHNYYRPVSRRKLDAEVERFYERKFPAHTTGAWTSSSWPA